MTSKRLRGVLGQELAGLVGEIEQDRAGLDDGVGLPARTVMIDDGWNLAVGIDLKELGRELIALPDVDKLGVIGKFEFLERDENLLNIRTGKCIKIDHGAALPAMVGPQP